MSAPGPVLFIAALDDELARVRRAVTAAKRAELLATGSGAFAAEQAVRAALARGPRAVVAVGFSGALAPDLAPGELVLATSLRAEGEEAVLTPPPEAMQAALQAFAEAGIRVSRGALLTASQVATDRAHKSELGKTTRAAAIDLESYWVALAAAEAGVRWLCVRAVVDPLSWSLPAFTAAAGKRARDWLAPALRHALTNRSGAAELARLGWAARKAAKSLGHAVETLAPALAGVLAETA